MSCYPTRVEFFNIGANEILARSQERPPNQRISSEAIRTEGSDINIITAACAAMADEATRHLADRMAALFLDSAEGADLDRLVADRFSPTIVRKQPVASVVELTFTRAGGPLNAVTLGLGTLFRTDNGTEFSLAAPASFAAGSTSLPAPVLASAVVTGSTGEVAPLTITQFVAPPTDPNIVVTNLEAATGGSDVETDANLRERARDFFIQARRGTGSAIEFGALTVGGVDSATVVEVLNEFGEPFGPVLLYIADINGQANQALVDAVQLVLLEFRAQGIPVTIFPGQPRFIAIDFRLRFEEGTDKAAAFETLRFLVDTTVNTLDPGETLEVATLFALAKSVPGLIVRQDAVQEPGGDVCPVVAEIIKTRTDLITFTQGDLTASETTLITEDPDGNPTVC